jgi:hypothetical protein
MKLGLIEISQIALILLKAFGVVAWSWWLIFLPTFATLGVVAFLFTLIFVAVFTFPQEATKWQSLGKRLR